MNEKNFLQLMKGFCVLVVICIIALFAINLACADTLEPEPPPATITQDTQLQTPETTKDYGLSDLTKISDTKALIKIYSMITMADAIKLWDDFFILKSKTSIRDIDIYIASPGGEMFGGFAIIEQLKKAKTDGFHITAYGISIIGSMAIPIYACCETRIAYKSTIFMVHPSTLQTGDQMMTGADLTSRSEFHTMSEELYIDALVEFTKLSKEEWKKRIEKDTWFGIDKAIEWGLVDKVE